MTKLSTTDRSITSKLGTLVLLLSTLSWCAGCTGGESDKPSEPSTEPVETYMAISGGGWRTHTAQAAWTMGLLQAFRAESQSPVTLDTVFGSVSGISSNSGGSWFNTMLVYSSDFSTAIEASNAISTYGSTSAGGGYLGQERVLLNDPSCTVGGEKCGQGDHQPTCFECNVRKLTNDEYTYWNNIVDDVVFSPYKMADHLANTHLSGPRETWADGKSLLFAATMVTDNVVVNSARSGVDEIYYTVTEQVRSGVPPQVSVTPVAFSSIPASSSLAPPDFFLAGDMELKYASNADLDPPSPGTATLSNSGLNSDVPVLAAAASSSAAAGAQASQTVEAYQKAKLPWTDAYAASGLAPGFKLDQSVLTPALAVNDTQPQTLATEKFIRLADGGFLDNSAVAHLINFLQGNDESNFNIIAFDNVQQFYTPPGLTESRVPVDIAYLFGEGPPNVPAKDPTSFDPSVFCADGYCVQVPLQKVFAPEPLMTTPASWTYTCDGSTDSGNSLSYTKYAVTTVDNPTLGIAANLSGTLHVFAAIFPNADTAPNKDTADWEEYQTMLGCIYDGMANEGGAKWFQMALLPSESEQP